VAQRSKRCDSGLILSGFSRRGTSETFLAVLDVRRDALLRPDGLQCTFQIFEQIVGILNSDR
jgi:hypothetical protein